MSSKEPSYYEILGVEKDATEKEIKKKYRELMKQYHPDMAKDQNAVDDEKAKKINEAYSVLSDSKKRQHYDAFGKDNGAGPGHDMEEMLSKLFGGGMAGMAGMPKHHHQMPQIHVPPVKHVLEVTLKDIFTGKTADIIIDRYNICKECNATGFEDKKEHHCVECKGTGRTVIMRPLGPGMMQQIQTECPQCKGTGGDSANFKKCDKCEGKKCVLDKCTLQVKLESGSKNQEVMTIENEGHEYPTGNKRGDVKVIVHVEKHPVFERGVALGNQIDHSHLLINLKISLAEALCGFKRDITHLDGKIITICEVDPINHDQVKYLPDAGLPRKGNSFRKGALFVKYSIEMPKLKADQKGKLYEILTGNKLPATNSSDDNVCVYTNSIEDYTNDSDEEDDDSGDEQAGPQCATQ